MFKEGNVLSWASDVDGKAMAQAHRASKLPFVEGHIALMPDAHFGMGATVGSVIPTRGAIIPSAVGVDIGCGMIAAELPFTSNILGDDLTILHGRIAKVVPAGVGKGHEHAAHNKHYPGPPKGGYDTERQGVTAERQFGTLGSGNHFVEVCLDERDIVWVVLHSGSRGIGNQLAQHHIKIAKSNMKEMFITLEDPDLAYFVQGTRDFEAYIEDMLWAQSYALGNREAMMDAVLAEIAGWIGRVFRTASRINCHHNYTEQEQHHGKTVWLTRKGAIRAREGDRGVIPGSMGTQSYIVRGLGNPASYFSCSHGAGRRMSRGEAKRTLDLETLKVMMRGRAWNDKHAEALLDEDPRAYKDIDKVMEDQKDLVEIRHTLRQVLNYKGL